MHSRVLQIKIKENKEETNEMENKPVDFMDATSIEEELKAVEANQVTTEPKAKKERKPAKPRIITITVPEGLKAGDTFEFEVPKAAMGTGRGMLIGLTLDEMTDDQLKIEYRNANSVFYKQKKAKGTATPVATERLEAVKAAMEIKGIQPTSKGGVAPKIDAAAIAELIKSGAISVLDIQAMLDAK